MRGPDDITLEPYTTFMCAKRTRKDSCWTASARTPPQVCDRASGRTADGNACSEMDAVSHIPVRHIGGPLSRGDPCESDRRRDHTGPESRHES